MNSQIFVVYVSIVFNIKFTFIYDHNVLFVYSQWMVTSSKDRTVRLWFVPDNGCRAVCEGHTDPVGAVCLSHFQATYTSRKAFLVSGAGDKILKRWALPLHSLEHTMKSQTSLLTFHNLQEASIKKLLPSHSIRGHDKDINCVAVSPNDSMLASASQDKSIRLWNTEDLSPIATLTGHKRGVWKVLFSPVDKLLVSCSGDRTVKLWSVVDYTIVKTLEGHTASVLNARFVNHSTQLLSSSADGLIRLWTVRTGECENTFDRHDDRVWALTTMDEKTPVVQENDREPEEQMTSPSPHPSVQFFVSGGSDSKLILWKDVTDEEEQQRLAEAEKLLVLEQQMNNDIRGKHFGKALTLAISLGHPSKVLMILTTVLEEDKDSSNVLSGPGALFNEDWSRRLDPYVQAWSDEELQKLLQFLKEWNTNSRNCYVSQILLNSLFRVVKVEKLMQWKEFREMSIGIQAYTERHFQRLNRLSQAAHFLDYIVSVISIMPKESLDALAIKNSASKDQQSSVDVNEVNVTRKRKIASQ
jgi:U3 small nucleolar RNA-associated protein 13